MGGPTQAGSTGKIDVNVSDQYSRILDLRFIQATAPPTLLTVAAIEGDTSITIADTTAFIAGRIVAMFTVDGNFYFGQQIGPPVGQVITLDTPVDTSYPVGSNTLAATKNMAVDGSVTTETFQIGPVGGTSGVELDITRVMGYIQDGSAMDDAKFGGIAGLTKGVVLRRNNDVMQNVWNMKTNGELSELCFDFAYTSKAPAGSYGARFRNTFSGQDKHGVTIRLVPGDTLEVLIQDDLTDLETFTMTAQGHIVENR